MPLPKIHDRRERRIARRRADILEAAMKVFAEKGIRQATTKEIAEAADIAEGTIYNYFANKEELVAEMLMYIGDVESRILDYVEGLKVDLRTFFHDYMLKRYRALEGNHRLIAVVFSEVLNTPELRDIYMQRTFMPGTKIMEDHLRTRIERGELPPMDVPTITRLLIGTILGLHLLIATGDEVTTELWADPQKFTDVLTDFLFNGLTPRSDAAE
ncbi:MAG: TetR/AcrR family transcriptional regulator; helix-turn-helix transcriptional regulator [Anaerolineae bacterium]|nr:TetR/AcrR family transcriptional regulator; helix-turn-helix transcriptional regulator [Anaerolineae bacterium]